MKPPRSSRDFDGYVFLGFKDGHATFFSRYGKYEISEYLLNIARFLCEEALENQIDSYKEPRLPKLKYEGDA